MAIKIKYSNSSQNTERMVNVKKYNNTKIMSHKHQRYRKLLWILLIANMLAIFGYSFFLWNQKTWTTFNIPVDAAPVKRLKVMPVGAPVGIYIHTKGVMVLDTEAVTDQYGKSVEPANGLIQAGDYIININGEEVDATKDVTAIVEECQGQCLEMIILRDGKEMQVSINPVKTIFGKYMTGIWVRDDTQGIGTLSFIDEKNHFATLGHGITDVDTGMLIDINGGNLYPAQIKGIIKAKEGDPGEMVGTIYYSNTNCMGTITHNSGIGVYGELNEKSPWQYDEEKAVEVATKDEIHEGDAKIRCWVNGEVNDYAVKICSVDYENKNKNFVIQVVDERLLEVTNGIVQGMSGSPILQDGKLVGAVTHVLVNDPTRGYGIFIENMLDAAA